MDLVFLVVLGLVVYSLYRIMQSYNKSNNIMSREEFKDYLTEIIHQVRTEKIDDVEYWYDSQNGVFLGQGFNLEEIINHVKSRFPEHIFLLSDVGGLAAITDWKIMPFAEFEKLTISNFKTQKNVTKKPE